MRKAALLATALTLGICLTGIPWPGTVSAADTIKIGVIYSATGYAQARGNEQKDALTALTEDVNGKGGVLGKKLELIFVDDKGEPTTAAAAADKLAREDKVSAILGTTSGDCSAAVVPVVDKANVPYILMTPVATPFNKWVYPIGPGDRKQTAHALELAISTFDAKKIALLYEANTGGSNVLQTISGEIGQYPGASLVAKESFGQKDTDVTSQLAKVKAANPDVVILLASMEAANVAIVQSCKQMGIKTPFVALRAFGSPSFLKNAGPTVEELKWNFMMLRVMVAESMPPTDAYRRLVYAPMKKIMDDKYGAGRLLTTSMGTSMDALNMVVLGLKGAGSDDRAALRDALEKVKFQGLLGGVAPGPDDHQAGARDTSVLANLKDGKFVPSTK
jgi:branched-chain amino acid transport system substrate-binding protein